MAHKKSTKDRPKAAAAEAGEKGWGRSIMAAKWLIIPILVLAGIVWFGFYATHTKEVAGSDDREYASIARNIVNGKGIVRNFVYPLDINFFEKLPIPEFMHPPGYPLILAGFFKLFGISDFSALLPSYLSYFLLVISFFLFVKKYLEMKMAILATVTLIFNKEILDVSLVALSEVVYTLLFFIFFSLFVRSSSLKAIMISGILLGVSHLIRENIYPFLIPLLVYLYLYPNLDRRRKMVFFIIGILIPVIPNMIRGFLETGSPFFSYGKFALMAYTDKYPWLTIYQEIQNPSLLEFLLSGWNQFILKYMNNLVTTLTQIISISNPYVLAFFVVELLYWKISPDWRRIKMLFLFLLISQILFVPLFTFTHRFFIPFLPMMIVFACQGFLRMSEDLVAQVKTHWRRRISSLAILLFLIFVMTPTTYLTIRPTGPQTMGYKTLQFGLILPKEEGNKLNEFLNNELKVDQVVWTDLPEILEWEGNRFCGYLPRWVENIYEIQKKIPVDAILITNMPAPYRKMDPRWNYLLNSEQGLPQYENIKIYKKGRVLAKLLIRNKNE